MQATWNAGHSVGSASLLFVVFASLTSTRPALAEAAGRVADPGLRVEHAEVTSR